MNEEKSATSPVDQQATAGQPAEKTTTPEDAPITPLQSEQSTDGDDGTQPTPSPEPREATPHADEAIEAAPIEAADVSTEPAHAETLAGTAAEDVSQPEAPLETGTPPEAAAGTETPPEASAASAPQAEPASVSEPEAKAPVLTKSPFQKPVVDEAKIEQRVNELIEGEKINRLDQKRLTNLLKKLADDINESEEVSVPFTVGARDILVGPAANRMLSQGLNRKPPKKIFVEASINLVGVQQQIAAHAQETEGQSIPVIDARRVKNARTAEAFCSLYPWC